MPEERFQQLLRECICREPFAPFYADLMYGQRILVDYPSVAFSGRAAGFLSDTEGLIRFSCDDLKAIAPATTAAKA